MMLVIGKLVLVGLVVLAVAIGTYLVIRNNKKTVDKVENFVTKAKDAAKDVKTKFK